MALQERTCKKCGAHWEIWKVFIRDLPKRPACPACGSRSTMVEIWGKDHAPPPVHFKGHGWTPKSGTVNDIRDIKGFDDPAMAEKMDE